MSKYKRFTAEATYYNISANSLFITFIGLLLTYYAWQKNGWGSLATSLLVFSIIMFCITIVLFFSKLSIRQIMIEGKELHVGKRLIQAENIVKIECIGIGKVFHIHVANIDESLTLRMKEKDRIRTRQFVQQWCKRHNIQFVDK